MLVAEGEGRKDLATHRLSGRARDNRLVHFADFAADGTSSGRATWSPPRSPTPRRITSSPTGRPLAARRTRSGDAWEARASEPTLAGVSLGMPSLGAPAPAPGRARLPLRLWMSGCASYPGAAHADAVSVLVESLDDAWGASPPERRSSGISSRADVDRALASGDIVVLARGRYALPNAGRCPGCRRGRALGSVALIVTPARGRPPRAGRCKAACPIARASSSRGVGESGHPRLGARDVIRCANLARGRICRRLVTSTDRTVVDCLRYLPEPRRAGRRGLRPACTGCRPPARAPRLARDARGPALRRRIRNGLLALASPERRNPFESALRAHRASTSPGSTS